MLLGGTRTINHTSLFTTMFCLLYFCPNQTSVILACVALLKFSCFVAVCFLSVLLNLIYDHTKIWVSTIDSLIAVKQRANFVASLCKRFAKRNKKLHPKWLSILHYLWTSKPYIRKPQIQGFAFRELGKLPYSVCILSLFL